MTTLTIALWFLSISIAFALGYVLGAFMTCGARADLDVAAPQRRSTIIGSRGRNSEPHLVLISPNEVTLVKTV